MDLVLLTPETIKLKGKKVQLLIDPTQSLRIKTEADAVIGFLHNSEINVSKVDGSRVLVSGPGEYEISGAKIGGMRVGKNIMYSLLIDRTKILLLPANAATGLKEDLDGYHVAIIRVDGDEDIENVLAAGVKVVGLYGKNAKAVYEKLVKDMEKEQASIAGKFSVIAEKMPEKTQLVLLN